jgi:methyl-accepting chemotaxis protein
MKSKTSIKSGLIRGLMLIVLFFLVQAGLVWYAIDSARSTVVESTRNNTVASSELGTLAVLAQQIRRYEKEYFVYVSNIEKRNGYEREWRDALDKFNATLTKMKAGSGGAFAPKDIVLAEAWSDAATFYASEMQKIFLAVNERAARAAADKETRLFIASPAKPLAVHVAEPAVPPAGYTSIEANDMIKAGKDRFSNDLIKGVAAMAIFKTADTLALAQVTKKMFNQVLVGVMITVAIGVIVALLLSIRLPRTVIQPIDGLSVAAHEMSMGNLSQAYDSGGVTEFDKLAEALNRMRLGQQALVERLQKRQ